MRPFVYRCASTNIPVITELYASMFDWLPSAEFPYPCPGGHLHTLGREENKSWSSTRVARHRQPFPCRYWPSLAVRGTDEEDPPRPMKHN